MLFPFLSRPLQAGSRITSAVQYVGDEPSALNMVEMEFAGMGYANFACSGFCHSYTQTQSLLSLAAMSAGWGGGGGGGGGSAPLPWMT